MDQKLLSIRAFIGARDYEVSKSFYRDWGFEEVSLGDEMCLFKTAGLGFYLQRAYVKDWVDNTMLFLEVEDTERYWTDLVALNLTGKYAGVRLVPIRTLDWGKEFFLHDPSGILWHIGSFNK